MNIRPKSIAVLPFVNMSNSIDNEYFCDGITEEIINALAKIKELSVTSRTSSFYFKNKKVKPFEVKEKLLVQRITGGTKPIKVAYDNSQFYNKESINNIILKADSNLSHLYLLCLLNSSLINWFYSNQFTNESTLTVNISKEYLSQIPIKISTHQDKFKLLAQKMIDNLKNINTIADSFLKLFSLKFNIQKPSKKLQNWHALDFGEFLKELEKARKKAVKDTSRDLSPLGYKKLSLSEEAEWMHYFNEQKQKAEALKTEIDKTDSEIDQMVYKLYGLTEEEINIVEESTK